MAYADGKSIRELVERVLRGSLNFRGRSTRSEGVVYYFLVGLSLAVLSFATSALPLGELSFWIRMDLLDLLALLLQLPLVAWFVRRLHDQGKSGWFILIFPVGWGVNWLELSSTIHAILMLPLVIGLFALLFWPPTPGANRFGPNPRFDEDVSLAGEGGQA